MERVLRLLLAAGVLVAGTARAQIVDVQRLFSSEQREGLSAGVDGSIDLRRGDIDLTSLSGGLNVRWRRGDLAALFLASGERAQTADVVYLEKNLEHLRFRWAGARLQAETFFQHERDEFRRRELRGLWGVGPRHVALDTDRASLAVGLAAMAEYERLSEGPYADSGLEMVRARGSMYGSGRVKLDDRIGVGQTLYVQPAFDAPDDVRALSDTELAIALTAALSLRLTASVSYDSAPPEGIGPTQAALKTTFHFELPTGKTTETP